MEEPTPDPEPKQNQMHHSEEKSWWQQCLDAVAVTLSFIVIIVQQSAKVIEESDF
jgi:hypothetical protein